MRHLTAAELGIWLGQQSTQQAAIYNCAEYVQFERPLRAALFEAALIAVLARAEILATRFVELDGGPRAMPPDVSPPDTRCWTDAFEYVPLAASAMLSAQGLSCPDRLTSTCLPEAFVRAIEKPFDLTKDLLSRHLLVTDGADLYGWLHVAHHVALDGFGFQLITRAVAAEYSALVAPSATTLRQFGAVAIVVANDSSYRESEAFSQDASFFRTVPWSRYPSARLVHYESADRPERPSAARPIRVQGRADESTFERLQSVARERGASWPELLLAAVARFAARSSGQRRFALGVPVMLRLGTPKLNVPCMAMNIVRLPLSIGEYEPLTETLSQVRCRWKQQSPHHRHRYEDLGDQRFGPVVNVLPFTEQPSFGAVASSSTNLSAGPVTDLSIMAAQRGRELELTFDGHPALFTPEALTAMNADFIEFLTKSLESAGRSLASSSAPARGLASLGNTSPGHELTTLPVAVPPQDVIERWLSVVEANPGAVALVDGPALFTRGELKERVVRYAANLRLVLDAPNDECAHLMVAIELGRSCDAIALLLAVLYVGAGYAFVDPEQPLARRADLVTRLEPALLITSSPEHWARALPAIRSVSPVALEAVAVSTAPAIPEAADPAYVVFTSGSTGTPKGVVIGRHALASFVASACRTYGLGPNDHLLQFAPLTFDASVEEIFGALCSGATLTLRNATMLDSMQAFGDACSDWTLSVLDLPTAFWHEWVQALAAGSSRVPSSLRLVIIGGEAADPARVEAFRRCAPNVRLLNTYGPSEATVVATCADLSKADLSHGVSIGHPLTSVQTWLLGSQGELLSGACEGELGLSGPQLAAGYLHHPAETKVKFVELGSPLRRIYRTGDRVRRTDSGELYFLGRIDHEIKLSGYRISPTEIEAVLNRNEQVAHCAVTATKSAGQPVLTAHVQLHESTAPTASDQDLREYLLARLPAPMVPTRYVVHAALPTNASGKLDRRLLSELDVASCPTSSNIDPMFTRSPGRELLEVWRSVLGRQDAAPDDDFFRLGGHSLQVIQLAARLSPISPMASVSAVFRHPTPRKLLAFISDNNTVKEPQYQEVAKLTFDPTLGSLLTRDKTHAPSVLLTGATGFVGVHLVAELLRREARVTCLVRGRDSNQARQRLIAALAHHRLSVCATGEHQLRVVALEIGQVPTRTTLADLGYHSHVIHCAADVNLTRSFASLTPTNVTATRWLLDYAHAAGARFSYVSTLAVAPSDNTTIPERLFDAHPGLIDGYQQSKWHAERLCQTAAEMGLEVQVVRLGRVVGSRDAAGVNPSDIVWRIARASTRCGYWPELDFAEVWTTVDHVAEVIVDLNARAPRPRPGDTAVYQVAHQGVVRLERLRARLTAAGHRLNRCEVGVWVGRVRARADEQDLATLAFFELASERSHLPSDAPFACDNLKAALPHLDDTPLSDALIDRYIASATATGLLPSPLDHT